MLVSNSFGQSASVLGSFFDIIDFIDFIDFVDFVDIVDFWEVDDVSELVASSLDAVDEIVNFRVFLSAWFPCIPGMPNTPKNRLSPTYDGAWIFRIVGNRANQPLAVDHAPRYAGS